MCENGRKKGTCLFLLCFRHHGATHASYTLIHDFRQCGHDPFRLLPRKALPRQLLDELVRVKVVREG